MQKNLIERNDETRMWKFTFQIFLLVAPIWLTEQVDNGNFQEFFGLKWVDFAFKDPQHREAAIKSKQYIAENVVMLDSDVYAVPNQIGRAFATTPAVLMEGIPATLSVMTRNQKEDPILLQPFPSWEANDKSTCESLISVFRIQIDKCGQLWALDCGIIDVFVSKKHLCPPKLVIYDLNKNDGTEVLRYVFPPEALYSNTALLNLVLESSANDCSDTVAYMADVVGSGLTVFHLKDRISYRFSHPRLYPDPDFGIVETNGVTFNLMDGVFGLALSPPDKNPRTLYWQCFASIVDSWVSTAILKDQKAVSDTNILNKEIHTSDPAREGQGTVMVMTDGGILIYALATRNALFCWNRERPFTKENQIVLLEDNESLQFVSGMKLHGKELIITSTKLQKFIVQAMVPDEIKYRIISVPNVDDLLKGSKCL